MGLRDTMDATFALHHLAHAHNALTSPDHLAGQDAKTMAGAQVERRGPHVLRRRARVPRRGARAGSRRTCRGSRCRRATRPRASRLLTCTGRSKLFDARWAVVSWPKAYGGREASLVEWLIFEEEYYRAGRARSGSRQNGIFLLAPTLFEFGTAEQKARILPRMAAAEDLWAQGWSEPNAGSDLAGIKSRRGARRGHGRLAPLAGRRPGARAARSATRSSASSAAIQGAERHQGLTYFLVPLRAPGVTVRPVRPPRRRRGLRRGLPRRRLRPRPRRARQGATRAGTSPWPPRAPSAA